MQSFNEMSDAQRDAAFALLGAGFSAKGLKLTRDIMKLNHTLAELNNNNFAESGEWLYRLRQQWEPHRRTSRGAGSSMAITRSSTTSSWAMRS